MTTRSPIRVLHLVASSHGGGATHVRDLAQGLSCQHYLTSVAMPDDDGIVKAADFTSHGVTFHPITGKIGPIRALATQADILHCHGARAAFWGRLATMALGARRPKIIYSIHGFMIPHYPWPRRLLLTLQEKMQARQVDQYIAVSHAERETLRRAGLGNDDNVAVVWYGIEVEQFEKSTVDRKALRARFGIKPDDVLLIMICRFFWPRDFPTLLYAFRQAVSQIPNVRLLLVGDGPWRPQIKLLLDKLDLQQQVIMPGMRQDIVDLLHAAEVFVLTSGGGDGLPISILEAMAAARPVIATATDGIPEEVIAGETGFVPPLHDVTALAQAMVHLAEDANLRQTMGLAGQQRARAHFRKEQMVAKISPLYLKLIEQ